MLTQHEDMEPCGEEEKEVAESNLERERKVCLRDAELFRVSSSCSRAHRSGTCLQTHGSLGYEKNTGREINSAVARSYLLQPELLFLQSLFSRTLIRRIILAAVTAQSLQSSASCSDRAFASSVYAALSTK